MNSYVQCILLIKIKLKLSETKLYIGNKAS